MCFLLWLLKLVFVIVLNVLLTTLASVAKVHAMVLLVKGADVIVKYLLTDDVRAGIDAEAV